MIRLRVTMHFVRDSRGMTLLEVMLATLVLAMVVSMVTFSLSGSLRAVDTTMEQDALYRRAEIAFARIREDLAGVLLPDSQEFIGERRELGGVRADSLRFVSLSHLVFSPDHEHPGVGAIAYLVEADAKKEDSLILYRADTLLLPGLDVDKQEGGDKEPGFVLCDDLRSVSFSFVDAQGQVQENWTTVQEEGTTQEERLLPQAVFIRLEFWLDKEAETSLQFETSVQIPAGAVRAVEAEDEQGPS